MAKTKNTLPMVSATAEAELGGELRMICFADLISDRERYSFRDKEEFEASALESLAEDIAAEDVSTPILVARRDDGKFDVLDGNRRFAAIKLNIEKGVKGFTDQYLVPAHILPGNPSEQTKLARAAATNIQRKAFSAEGRMRAAVQMSQAKMTNAEIAKVLQVSEMTVGRDLALGKNKKMLRLVNEGIIPGSTAASLLATAAAHERVDDLVEAINDFGEKMKKQIGRERMERLQRKDEPLSAAECQPKKRLSGEQVKSWSTAIKAGSPLSEPTFEFFAGTYEDDHRVQWLKILPVKVRLDDLKPEDLAKVAKGLANALATVAPALKSEHKPRLIKSAAGLKVKRAAHILTELGIDKVVDELAPNAAEFEEAEEEADNERPGEVAESEQADLDADEQIDDDDEGDEQEDEDNEQEGDEP